MKNILILILLINSAFAETESKLDMFFNTQLASDICSSGTSMSGKIRRTSLKFIKNNEDSVFFVKTIDGNSTVLQYKYDGTLVKNYSFEGTVRNINSFSKEFIILVEDMMYVFDRATHQFNFRVKTLPSHLKYTENGYAYGVYVYNDVYYIAHGENGVIAYDSILRKHLPNLELSIPQPLTVHRSMVTDIVGTGSKIYLSLDDVTLARETKAFEGLITFDLEANKQERVYPLNQKREAYYMTNLDIQNNNLIVSNLHLNFIHSIPKLEKYKFLRPQRRVWRYKSGKLLGKGIVTNNKIYGCFLDEKNRNVLSAVDHL